MASCYAYAALLLLANVVIVLGRATNGPELIDRTPYLIRSVEGGLLLRSIGGGQHCKGAGQVITSSHFDVAESVTWTYTSIGPWAYFDTTAGNYYLNEFSFYPEGPFCYPGGRTVTIVTHEDGSFTFENPDITCLTSNGNDKRISWTACNAHSENQRWTLEKTSK